MQAWLQFTSGGLVSFGKLEVLNSRIITVESKTIKNVKIFLHNYGI